jgi:O-antigen ligase
LADGLAVALVASLPWSTSATGILVVLWLLAVIPALDWAALRRAILIPAGALPLILVGLGVAGMFWASVTWSERIDGISSFAKLTVIPLLLCRFSQSNRGRHVLIGFVLSCTVLLIYSWIFFAWPNLPVPGKANSPGIPVKDYISQSAMFTICIFVNAQIAVDLWRRGRHYLALALAALCLIFFANIMYVATSRTALVVILILLVIFGLRQFGWKGAIGLVVGCAALAAVAWPSAGYLRERVGTFVPEISSDPADGVPTSAGERLTFWTKSVGFIRSAPIIGHGAGSIHDQFEKSAVGRSGMAAEAAANPHNQILAVGIQLGFVGIFVLLAMWGSHLMLFRSGSMASWVGLVVVVQNVIGSLFNSHLFDFTHGWLYVAGVGIAGGIALKESAATRSNRGATKDLSLESSNG